MPQSAVSRVILEQFPQLTAATVQARHHGADRRFHDVGDLLVGEPFDVGQVDRDPELLRQRLQGLPDVRIGQAFERLRLG